MYTSYFILSEKSNSIAIERLHICTWEFDNNTSLIEFGFEVKLKEIKNVKDAIVLQMHIPWLNESNRKVTDLYPKLKDSENSKFIFNDSIKATESLDGGNNHKGVIQTFFTRTPLCLLPAEVTSNCTTKCLTIKLDLSLYLKLQHENKPNIYFRFYLEPSINSLSTRKAGISKSTIIYDIKVNERRSAPDEWTFNKVYEFPKIEKCFFLQIVPTNFDITFYESSLQNIRILEYESFTKYIGDKRVKKDTLLVIFNKKVHYCPVITQTKSIG